MSFMLYEMPDMQRIKAIDTVYDMKIEYEAEDNQSGGNAFWRISGVADFFYYLPVEVRIKVVDCMYELSGPYRTKMINLLHLLSLEYRFKLCDYLTGMPDERCVNIIDHLLHNLSNEYDRAEAIDQMFSESQTSSE